MTDRRSWLLLFIVLFLAGIVRFWQLDARSVWFDEAFSLELATNCGIIELLDRTGRDVHPPGYYLVLKAWMWIAPPTEYGIRSLSAILGVIGVGLMYLVTKSLSQSSRIQTIKTNTDWIALSAALLLATNAQHIYWSREARMYAQGVVLTLLSTWFMLQWLEKRKWTWGLGAALTTAALMLTHNFGLFTAVSQFLCAVWYEGYFRCQTSVSRKMRSVVTVMIPWIFAAWLYLPWFTVLLQQRARVQQEFWIQPFKWHTLPTVLFQHVFPLNGVGPVIDWLVLASAGVVLFAAGVVSLWFLIRAKWSRDPWTIPAVMGLGPVLIAVLVSIGSVSVIDTRHLSYCFPFLLMLFCGAVYWLLPREWVVYTIVFASGWSLFGELQHRASLQTDQRGGVRAAMKALGPKLSDSELVVVQHPGIYHAVCFYLPNRDRIKLYLPAGLPRHFYGRPLVRQEELITGSELEKLTQPRLVAVDTGGFGGDQGFPLPERWQPQNAHVEWFQDVAWFQGSIAAREYVPQTLPVVAAGCPPISENNLAISRTSKEFRWEFTQHQFDREWFSLSTGVGESGTVRPTAAGLAFLPSTIPSRENHFLSVRQSVLGDFHVKTVWTVPGDSLSPVKDLSLRFLLTQDSSLFDVEPVDIRIAPNESVIELHCGRENASFSIDARLLAANRLEVSLRRVGRKLSACATVGDRSAQCETWITDLPMQLHLGDVVVPSQSASDTNLFLNARCFLEIVQVSADSIQYHSDDGIKDITSPPPVIFWKSWSILGLILSGTVCVLGRRSVST